MTAVDPQPVRHHPLPQRLDADRADRDAQPASPPPVWGRSRGNARGPVPAPCPEGLAMLAVARPAALARRQRRRAIRRKCATQAVNT